jgi:hypothetical protein
MLNFGSPLAFIASVAALITGPGRGLASLALSLSVVSGGFALWPLLAV